MPSSKKTTLKKLSEFIIRAESLSLGSHDFDYCLNDAFFTFFGLSEIIINGEIAVSLKLTKHSNMLHLQFKLSGNVTTPCDRCLEPLEIEIKGEPTLTVKYGEELLEETDEIMVIPNGEKELDISSFLYETVYLLIPQRNIHKKEQCNPEVIKKLNTLIVKEKSPNNPQWDILKKIKNK
ncbi:hypothetical protein FLAV_00442 [Flavobacteriales bacterium]|nr:hypothetical protein [Flavobacteriales bacterium]CAG0955960.1 hypothetical protein FLAV_00442 [Flavobacteriales bacterium]